MVSRLNGVVSYSPGQAAAKKSLIALDLATIEDVARHLQHVVGDHQVNVEFALEPLREAAGQLYMIIDRRTR
jgi:hypothetical protein